MICPIGTDGEKESNISMFSAWLNDDFTALELTLFAVFFFFKFFLCFPHRTVLFFPLFLFLLFFLISMANFSILNFIPIVAERISHFCLARNLIRPLGSTHNFTQSGWLILFIPNYLSGQHNLGSRQTPSLAEQLRSVQTSYCLLFNSSSSIDTMREGV